jgi:hypothetical protein
MHRNCLEKSANEGNIEGKVEVTEKEEEGVSIYWMSLSKREDTGN